jgi:hypothetical protein
VEAEILSPDETYQLCRIYTEAKNKEILLMKSENEILRLKLINKNSIYGYIIVIT